MSVTICRLRPLIFLPASKPRGPPAFRRLHRLAVDDAGGRACFSSRLRARRHDQKVIDAGEHAGARPSVEIALHRRIRRKLFRQLPPLAARGCHIQDRVHDRSQFRFAWATERRGRRKQRLDQRPFRIRQIACVSQPVPAILPPGDFRLGHLFPSNLANPKESQPAEITQLLFQSASKLDFADFKPRSKALR